MCTVLLFCACSLQLITESVNELTAFTIALSIFTARKYPFYMFQWHPAKPQFEWSPLKDISHTQEAVLASQYWGNYFINQGKAL